jgi:hypothetical protein
MSLRALCSGFVVSVDDKGHATKATCTWLVEVHYTALIPTDAPPEAYEIDFPSDVYRTVECGARLKVLGSYDPEVGHTCEHGHDRLPMDVEFALFGPAWERERMDEFEETGRITF